MLYSRQLPTVYVDTDQYPCSCLNQDCSGDCACGSYLSREYVGRLGDSEPILSTTTLRVVRSVQKRKLDEEHSIWHGTFNAPVVLNQAAESLLSLFDSRCAYIDAVANMSTIWDTATIERALDQMLKAKLLVSSEYVPSAVFNVSGVLSAWLHLTDQCNLACSYCYLPHASVTMSDEIGYAAIDAVFRAACKHRFSSVKLKYAGGEPLLRFSLVRKLHQYAQSLAEQSGIMVRGIVLTNGTLFTSEMARTIRDLDLKLMISLDGIGESNDSQRSRANGRPSFSRITRGIRIALDHGLVPTISVTVTGRNVDALPRLIAWLLAHQLPFGLNFYRESQQSVFHQDLKLEDEKIIRAMLATFREIETNLPTWSLLSSILDRTNLAHPHEYPCRVGHDYMVIRPDGKIASCQMRIEESATDIFVTDPLGEIRSQRVKTSNPSVNAKLDCHTCNWRYWCAGGCPLTSRDKSAGSFGKSSFCDVYQALLPEVIRLEGLRLLKYSGSVH